MACILPYCILPKETKDKQKKDNSLWQEKQALISIIFMIVVVLLDMLPGNYLALVAMILVFLWCIAFTSQAVRKKRGTAGKIYSLLMVCVLAFGTYNIAEANNMLSMITGGNTRVDKMAVAVLADNPAETIEDAIDYDFGVQIMTLASSSSRAGITYRLQ